jgi:hypothetical protein
MGVVWHVCYERYTRVLMEASPEFPIHFLKIYSWVIGMPLYGEVRALATANLSRRIRHGLVHRAAWPKNACRIVGQGYDALQYVPSYDL